MNNTSEDLTSFGGVVPYYDTITVRHITHGSVNVKALIIGQMALHSALENPDCYVITHKQTGFSIAIYDAYHVAFNFAKRVNAWYDIDALVSGGDYEHFKQIGREIYEMSRHPARVYIISDEYDPQRGKTAWNYIKGDTHE